MTDDNLDRYAAAAHDAWYVEKVKRLAARQVTWAMMEQPLTWPSETGEEQLVPWSELSEPVREFDRIVVLAILKEIWGE
jgi:hypothetical protein